MILPTIILNRVRVSRRAAQHVRLRNETDNREVSKKLDFSKRFWYGPSHDEEPPRSTFDALIGSSTDRGQGPDQLPP